MTRILLPVLTFLSLSCGPPRPAPAGRRGDEGGAPRDKRRRISPGGAQPHRRPVLLADRRASGVRGGDTARSLPARGAAGRGAGLLAAGGAEGAGGGGAHLRTGEPRQAR